jgi:chromosome segregation ATPase
MINEENLNKTNGEAISNLRSKINQESVSILRSKTFGGLNEEDVKKYIDSIEDKYQKIVKEMNEKMNVISSARNKLQGEYQIYVNKTVEEKKILQVSLDKAQKSLAENNSKTAELQVEIDKIVGEKKELERALTQSSREIEELKKSALSNQEFAALKKSVAGFEQENNDLKAKIAGLEKQISSKETDDVKNNKLMGELEQQIEIEKERSGKLSIDFELSRQKIIDLEKIIAENKTELERLQQATGLDEQELKLEKARALCSNITGFKDEIKNIHLRLESLTEEQAKINDELQEQLETEHLRAKKAENGLEEMIKSISELKDKLDSEQNQFKNQFKQLSERHDQFQSEIKGCFHNLYNSCNNYILSK